jgi:hypothetical protein
LDQGSKISVKRCSTWRERTRRYTGAQNRALTPKWTSIFSLDLVSRKVYAGDYGDVVTLDSLTAKIDQAWKRFVEQDLPPIRDAIRNADLPAVEV